MTNKLEKICLKPTEKVFTIHMNKKEYKKEYTLHGRIGIRIAQFIGLIKVDIYD